MSRVLSVSVVLIFLFMFTASAEHKLGKELTGKLIDKDGKEFKTDLSKKKNIILYFTASW